MAQGCDASATPLTASQDWIEFSLIKRGQSTKTAKQLESGQNALHQCGCHIHSTVRPEREGSTIQKRSLPQTPTFTVHFYRLGTETAPDLDVRETETDAL